MDRTEAELEHRRWADLPNTLTVSELARVLRVGEDVVRRAAATKGIPARRLGRRWLFSRDALIAWWGGD